MAAIDKLYGSDLQYDALYSWVSENVPEYLAFFYERGDYANVGHGYNQSRPIASFSEAVDRWLLENCPFEWVRGRIREQYGVGSDESLETHGDYYDYKGKGF